MQCNSANPIHTVPYKRLERRNEQLDRHIAVRKSHGDSNLNWKIKLQVANEYVTHRHKFVEMFTQLENMEDRNLGSIKTEQH